MDIHLEPAIVGVIMTKDEFKRTKPILGGGWKCPCCGPKPGDEKKMYRRITRRVLKQNDKKLFDKDDTIS